MFALRLVLFSSACAVLPLFAASEDVGSSEPERLELKDAIDQALANNLGLVSARYRPSDAADEVIVEEAAFDVELFGTSSLEESQSAAPLTGLDERTPQSETRSARVGADKLLSTGATVTVDTGINRFSTNNNATENPYSADVGLNFRQPLLQNAWREVNLAPLARAQAREDQSLFELRSEVLDVLAEVEVAYWDLAFARAAQELIASNVELAESLLEENRERERLGLVTKLEVLQAETELLNQQEDIIQADKLIEDTEDTLRRVMGSVSLMENFEDDIAVSPLKQSLPPLRPVGDVVRDTILSDADAQAQERAIEVARINQLLAKDAVRPRLDLTGRLDYTGRDDNGPETFRGAFSGDGYGWEVGLEVRFPWSFREARARDRQAGRALDQEVVQLYDIKQEKALAARNAWRSVYAGYKRVDVTSKALTLNEEAFEQERARYGSGLIAYRQVLEAQRDFDQARRSYLVALNDSIQANVRLSRVDGSILERNGFSWETVDQLATPPVLEDHSLADEITAAQP